MDYYDEDDGNADPVYRYFIFNNGLVEVANADEYEVWFDENRSTLMPPGFVKTSDDVTFEMLCLFIGEVDAEEDMENYKPFRLFILRYNNYSYGTKHPEAYPSGSTYSSPEELREDYEALRELIEEDQMRQAWDLMTNRQSEQ